MSTTMSVPDLADVLFACRLQPSADPTPDEVRVAIDELLGACAGAQGRCVAYVAQEAGDHPETYTDRMHWALCTVTRAYALAA
ncbi:hypothetical protein [Actinomadura alba]|uniref:Uncharacterized protein n=1 Tax=Actinomadura alba TaxID=406431 RepID=A0ABR7LMZ8_9ACTN|nr:hypothetical protein [Actinomadura alba]MBC6466217.1 hypothetical protein [Actinomadura alba]